MIPHPVNHKQRNPRAAVEGDFEALSDAEDTIRIDAKAAGVKVRANGENFATL